MQAETITETLSLTDEEKPLPDGWRLVRLGDICEVVTGGTPPRSEPKFYGGSIPWIKPDDLDKSVYVEKSAEYLTQAGGEISRLLPKGSVLVSCIGNIGKLAIASTTLATNQQINSLLPSGDIDSLYLYYACKVIKPKLNAEASISLVSILNKSNFSNVEIPLPPTIEEQIRIASILYEQMKAVEQVRSAVEEQLAAANLLPNAFLRSVFESEEAQNWQKRKLGELLNLRKEIVHPRNNPKGAALFVGLEHIESSTGKRIGSIEVKKEQLTGRKPQFYKGDLVYGYLRPYLNKLWVAEFDGLCSVDQYVYSVDTNEADTDYLAYFMRSPVYLAKAPIDTTPGQLPRIRTEEVASVEINLPDIKRQKDTAEKISEQMRQVNNLRTALTEKLEAIKKLPAALLRKAFAGKI